MSHSIIESWRAQEKQAWVAVAPWLPIVLGFGCSGNSNFPKRTLSNLKRLATSPTFRVGL
jgi:hypothetical protein